MGSRGLCAGTVLAGDTLMALGLENSSLDRQALGVPAESVHVVLASSSLYHWASDKREVKGTFFPVGAPECGEGPGSCPITSHWTVLSCGSCVRPPGAPACTLDRGQRGGARGAARSSMTLIPHLIPAPLLRSTWQSVWKSQLNKWDTKPRPMRDPCLKAQPP